ncbi:MAG: flagellar motor protein MotB [Lachnospiraceae bacterium]
MRRRRRRHHSEGHNVWRAYSDMMAGLLLLFVLVMCISFMEAQNNYREKLSEQAAHQQTQTQLQKSFPSGKARSTHSRQPLMSKAHCLPPSRRIWMKKRPARRTADGAGGAKSARRFFPD